MIYSILDLGVAVIVLQHFGEDVFEICDGAGHVVDFAEVFEEK